MARQDTTGSSERMNKLQPDLFDVGDRDPFQLHGRKKEKTCTPYPVGSGPDGQKCGTCINVYRQYSESGKCFLKCNKMMQHWTHGKGTDIKARWAACRGWRTRKAMSLLPDEWPRFKEINDLLVAADYWDEQSETDKSAMCRLLAQTDYMPNTLDVMVPENPDTPEQSGIDQNLDDVPF
jgi:hypothetical protein